MLIRTSPAWLFLIAGCASTRVVGSWQAPESAGQAPFGEVFVVALIEDEGMRQIAEREFVADLPPGTRGIPSYVTLSDDELRDTDRVRAAALEVGADAVTVFRPAGVEERVSYIPGTSMWGWYRGLWATPGRIDVDTIQRFQVTLFSADTGDAVWVGTTETFEPASFLEAIHEVAETVAQELNERNLISLRQAEGG